MRCVHAVLPFALSPDVPVPRRRRDPTLDLHLRSLTSPSSPQDFEANQNSVMVINHVTEQQFKQCMHRLDFAVSQVSERTLSLSHCRSATFSMRFLGSSQAFQCLCAHQFPTPFRVVALRFSA